MKTKIRKIQGGVPSGGTTGQALVKSSNSDFDYDWGTGSGNIIDINGGMPFTYFLGSFPTGIGSPPLPTSNELTFCKFSATIGSPAPLSKCYDYINNIFYNVAIVHTGSGNYNFNVTGTDSETNVVIGTWTVAGFSASSLPTVENTRILVDVGNLELFVRFTSLAGGTNTLDGVSLSSSYTYMFNMSSATGGTLSYGSLSFTGANSLPDVISYAYNPTTSKFLSMSHDDKYTFSNATGVTATTAISFGQYSGSNYVLPSYITGSSTKLLFKVITKTLIGSSSGSPSEGVFIENSYYPDYNNVLFT